MSFCIFDIMSGKPVKTNPYSKNGWFAAEQRSRLSQEERAPGTDTEGGAGGGGGASAGGGGYLDARQRALDEAAERRIQQIMRDYQHEINNYETLQKGTCIT